MSQEDLEPVALRPTTAVVDRGALGHNVSVVRGAAGGRRLMAIVKANAYGHGLIETSRAFLSAGVDELGVAFLEEGIELRRAGIRAPILVLGGIIGNQIAHFVEHDLEITASSPYKLRQIEEICQVTGRSAKVHLKIDTGMGRIGVQWDRVDALFEAALMAKHCTIVGVFTHFASADGGDKVFTQLQMTRFREALDRWRARGFHVPKVHAANSGAIAQHDLEGTDLVRSGALLYGFYPSPELPRTLPVRPALSLKTRVVYFKVLEAGSPVSYDSRWRAPRQTRVVTLPVGYGDGYMRALSGKASVLIGGQRRPIIGSITMDATMVDLGDGSAFNGDEVVLIGRQGEEEIRVEELAALAGTIPYEILTNINTRVPRTYVGEVGRFGASVTATRQATTAVPAWGKALASHTAASSANPSPCRTVCLCPTRDGNRPCTSSTECEGYCELRGALTVDQCSYATVSRGSIPRRPRYCGTSAGCHRPPASRWSRPAIVAYSFRTTDGW